MNKHRRALAGDKWRFVVIIIANVWLVFVIMRWGIARQQTAPPAEPERPAAEYSQTATLIASAALVGTVLALVVGVSHVCRRGRNRRSTLVIYREAETPPDSTDNLHRTTD